MPFPGWWSGVFFRPLEILRESLESADLHQIRTSADEVGRQGNRDIRSFAKSVGGLAKSLIDYQHRLLARERLVAFSTIATQVAHDIRSPLTALTMLTQKMEGVPESQRALLKDAPQRIQDIANDLLRRHKITNDADLAEEELKAPVPVAGLIEAIVAEKRIQLRDRTIEINARIDEGSSDAVVFVDGSRIKRVLSNIIENAIEAIESAGLITVASEVADRKVRIQIRDDGKGMDKTVLANVFKRGWTYGKTGGNGLGLSYAKDVIESHNGRIEIQSEVGQGTIVMIELPRAD